MTIKKKRDKSMSLKIHIFWSVPGLVTAWMISLEKIVLNGLPGSDNFLSVSNLMVPKAA